MPSGNYNLQINQGDTFNLSIIAKNCDGSRFDLNGYTGFAGIKKSYCATGYLGVLDVIITSPASGEVTLYMAATGTKVLCPTIALYDLEFASGNFTKKFLKGDVYIYPQISNTFP